MTLASSTTVPQPPSQRELFGFVAAANDQTTLSEPCPRCGSSVAVVGAGKGPHFKELRCIRGHHVRWLPWPTRAR